MIFKRPGRKSPSASGTGGAPGGGGGAHPGGGGGMPGGGGGPPLGIGGAVFGGPATPKEPGPAPVSVPAFAPDAAARDAETGGAPFGGGGP